ncbi:MAG: hypothetical protein HY698_12010 [Deltaproteobacteria bacterium]|nr:hypothetical protein [Deltaproteobacteria bacterium]
MPSFSHEFLVDLFRRAPRLAPVLLDQAFGIKTPNGQAEIGSVDLSQVTSPAYSADAVVRIRGDGNVQAAAAIVVEVQLSTDARKQLSWPVYVSALRAQLGCPVILLVVAPSDDVAAWARQSIDLGHPGFRLVPLVLAPSSVPRVTDASLARRMPELAVLSVLSRPDEAVAQAAIEAVALLEEDPGRLYFDVVWSVLPAALRHSLEAWMQKQEYKSDFARKYVAEGKAEGRTAGLVDAALKVAAAKLGDVDPSVEARIRSLEDAGKLEDLLVALAQAADEKAARAVLARL